VIGRPKFVLASGSPRRLALINQAGIEPDALRPAPSAISTKVTGLCPAMSMPISAMAATANATSSPLRTPAEPT
jgi:predicted house-cleaning NTP pyrophosphatase (Maf/HAM1 superfamily)